MEAAAPSRSEAKTINIKSRNLCIVECSTQLNLLPFLVVEDLLAVIMLPCAVEIRRAHFVILTNDDYESCHVAGYWTR